MSAKIKSKDLAYESSLPPFLQRLKDQHSGRGDTDRHEREVARPRKGVQASNEEDEPTIVDESGELVSQAELKERTAVEIAKAEEASVSTGKTDDDVRRSATDVSSATVAKKRKIAKVIGDDQHSEEVEQKTTPKKAAKTSKKKGKPIKLAFDEDDGS